MADSHKNGAATTVAVAPSPATTGTSMTLATGGGALMPSPPFNLTVWPAGVQRTQANGEEVRVTSLTGDVINTMVRQQEGSPARTIVVGDQAAALITNKTLTDIETVELIEADPRLIPGGRALFIPGGFEIASGVEVEVGVLGNLEIGVG